MIWQIHTIYEKSARQAETKIKAEYSLLISNYFSPSNYQIKLYIDIKMENLSPVYPVSPARHKYAKKIRT